MTFAVGSRARLTPRALPLFQDDTLLHRVARVVCRADCLPRKELFESWEVARRVRRRFRGGRVVDLACGHGLLAYLLLLLDLTFTRTLRAGREGRQLRRCEHLWLEAGDGDKTWRIPKCFRDAVPEEEG